MLSQGRFAMAASYARCGLAPDEHANAVNVANLKRVLGLALLGSGGKTKGKQEVVAYFLTIRIIRTGAAEHYGTNGGLKGATCSRDEVRRHDADELAGHDPLSSPQNLGKCRWFRVTR